MMKLKYIWFSIVALLLAITTACDDAWEQHYEDVNSPKIDMRLADYIKTQSDWSIFYQMLQQTGYDTVLNATQTYTVWVPENSALESIDLNDDEKVLEIVQGHISRFSLSTSGISSKRVYMLSGKYNTLYESGDGYMLVNGTLTSKDLLLYNGVIHSLDEYIPTIDNIWEYIQSGESLDSLEKFVLAQGYDEFDPSGSVKIGDNEEGLPIYDSAFIYSNTILSIVGDLRDEDSLYTVLLPKDEAWEKGFNTVKELFKTSEREGGVETQEYITGLYMLKDMAYRGLYENPAGEDSLISTIGSVMKDPARLFAYTEKVELSNGYAYVTDSFNLSLDEVGLDTLVIEAEDLSDIEVSNCEITAKSSLGTGEDLSEDAFLDVTFTGSAFSGAAVTIPIPNTLSTKYNIYCVFVPFDLEGGDTRLKTQVRFTLNYEDENGNEDDIRLRPEIDETDSVGVTKLFVGEFEFPVANVWVDERPEVKVSLKIQNALSDRSSKEGYSKDLRIDAIILEPVK